MGRKDSVQTVIRTSRRLESFLYEAAQKFEVFQKFESEIKIKNILYSDWCSFQGLSNGTTLMQIQSGRTVPVRPTEFDYHCV